MSTLVNSSFNGLPVKLKMEILQLLNSRDINSARLVCTYWFRLLGFICPPGFYLFGNNSEHLQILKDSFHFTIQHLGIEDYTESLPICTSTRCGIPRTKILELYEGNSLENMLKLLRNYAKCCERLALGPNCFEKLVEPFLLKGLAYESLRSLKIWFELPTNDLENFAKRNHLIALTQFLKTTTLNNLQEFNAGWFGSLPDENSTIQKFNQALISFFKRHGQQLTKLKYFYIIPSVLVNSLNNLCNLENFFILFHGEADVPIDNLNETHESFKHIKKLTSLKFIDCASSAFQYNSEFMSTMLKENRGIQKFVLHGNFTRMDWIPVGCELGLKEIKLEFKWFIGNLFTRTTNANQKLKSVSKLRLQIGYNSQPLMANITSWIIATFPNLTNLKFDITSDLLKLSHCRLLICNLVYLKKLFLVNEYRMIEDDSRNWLRQQNEAEFIKSIPFNGGLEISISRPFPNYIFDQN